MVNKKIIDTLKPLGIPTYYMSTGKQSDKYITFSIYNEKDTDKFDNKNLSETYYITLNYWYSNPKDLMLYTYLIVYQYSYNKLVFLVVLKCL